MKQLAILNICILILFSACSRKFHFALESKINSLGDSVAGFEIDHSYELYLRTILKQTDSVTKFSRPVNGTLTDTNLQQIIEVQYLFLSKQKNRVLIINNIANRRTVFYNSTDKQVDLAPDAENSKVDIWYFAQFRFGSVRSGNTFNFMAGDAIGKKSFEWVFREQSDTIFIKAINQVDQYNNNSSFVESAFHLPVYFVKANSFTLMLKENKGKGSSKKVPEEFIAERTIQFRKSKKGWFTVFRFPTAPRDGYHHVYFNTKRMYSPPIFD
jgi:hypothetical protein